MSPPPPFLGNRKVVEQIEQKIANRRLPHGLIFAGPEGVGKRTLAVRIAQTLNCRTPEPHPCGECDSCRRIARESDPHLTLVGIEDDASEIKIGQVRGVRESLDLEVEQDAARVVVIDPAQRLTTQASNALLKVLEEPPPRTTFILITPNPADLLVTIRSRCQIYRFAPLSDDELRSAGVTDELVIRWSGGSVGFALTAESEQLVGVRDSMLDFLEHALSADDDRIAALPARSAELARDKEHYTEKIRVLIVLVSDLVRLKHADEDDVVNTDRIDRLRRAAEAVSMDRLITIGETIAYIEAALRSYVHRQTLTDTLAIAINPRTSEILHDKARQSR